MNADLLLGHILVARLNFGARLSVPYNKPSDITPMSEKPQDQSSEKKGEDVEIKIVPEGTFAGQIDKPELVKEGEVIPEDTGDQGGGQN